MTLTNIPNLQRSAYTNTVISAMSYILTSSVNNNFLHIQYCMNSRLDKLIQEA